MTDMGIPSAYVRDKRTPPPSREELRARIPGWGVDLDPADRPSYPKLQYPADTGAHWEFPDRQPETFPRERSLEHAMLTPVFGTAQPRKGIAGAIRTYAYERFAEGRAAHWLLLVAADRVDAIESHLASFATTRPDNPITETGVKGEFTHNGWASRVGTGRTDVRHQVLDPVLVAGPWVVAVGAVVAGGRRLVRALGR
jgi:hypothetical protein